MKNHTSGVMHNPLSVVEGSFRIRKNVKVSGRRTSISLEEAVWDALGEICTREDVDLIKLCTRIDERRGSGSLASSIRTFVLTYFQVLASTIFNKTYEPGLSDGQSFSPAAVHEEQKD